MKKRLYRLDRIQERVKLPCKYDRLSPMEKADVRNRHVALQEGRCYHCKTLLRCRPSKRVREYPIPVEFRFPPTFFKNPIHLHHDHVTGFTLGATHALCNVILYIYHGE